MPPGAPHLLFGLGRARGSEKGLTSVSECSACHRGIGWEGGCSWTGRTPTGCTGTTERPGIQSLKGTGHSLCCCHLLPPSFPSVDQQTSPIYSPLTPPKKKDHFLPVWDRTPASLLPCGIQNRRSVHVSRLASPTAPGFSQSPPPSPLRDPVQGLWGPGHPSRSPPLDLMKIAFAK